MYNDYRYHQVLIKTLWVFQITFLQLIEICKIKVDKWLFGINRKKNVLIQICVPKYFYMTYM